jgi:hypothetical protein
VYSIKNTMPQLKIIRHRRTQLSSNTVWLGYVAIAGLFWTAEPGRCLAAVHPREPNSTVLGP